MGRDAADGRTEPDDRDDPELVALVVRAQAGDADAFADLVRRCTPGVRAVLRSRLRDPEDVADVTQEVFLRALRTITSLADPGRIEAWLATIARNCATDLHRARARRPAIPVDDHGDGPVDDHVGPDELTELRALVGQVRVGVGRLAPLDAALISMVALLGFTPTEIAEALGMTPNAAKVAVHRARQRLKRALLLEEAAGTPPVPCPEFKALAADGQLVPAALHARGCKRCRRASG